MCLDHTIVLAQPFDSEEACYPGWVDLLKYSRIQNRTSEVSSVCKQSNEQSSVLLDSTIFYCNSPGDHHADYVMDKTHITILEWSMYPNLNFKRYWQSENIAQSSGVMTHPQFVTFNMTKVFLVQNILAIFISSHNNLLDYMADMWLVATVVETTRYERQQVGKPSFLMLYLYLSDLFGNLDSALETKYFYFHLMAFSLLEYSLFKIKQS